MSLMSTDYIKQHISDWPVGTEPKFVQLKWNLTIFFRLFERNSIDSVQIWLRWNETRRTFLDSEANWRGIAGLRAVRARPRRKGSCRSGSDLTRMSHARDARSRGGRLKRDRFQSFQGRICLFPPPDRSEMQHVSEGVDGRARNRMQKGNYLWGGWEV